MVRTGLERWRHRVVVHGAAFNRRGRHVDDPRDRSHRFALRRFGSDQRDHLRVPRDREQHCRRRRTERGRRSSPRRQACCPDCTRGNRGQWVCRFVVDPAGGHRWNRNPRLPHRDEHRHRLDPARRQWQHRRRRPVDRRCREQRHGIALCGGEWSERRPALRLPCVGDQRRRYGCGKCIR